MPSCDFFGGEKYCSCSDCREKDLRIEVSKIKMTRGVPTPSSPKYIRENPARPQFCISKQDYKEAIEDSEKLKVSPKTYDGNSVLTRGKLQGKTFLEAIKNKKYVEYCRNNAKHFELQALVEFYDKNC